MAQSDHKRMAWHQQFTDAGSKSSIGLMEETSCIALCAIFNPAVVASNLWRSKSHLHDVMKSFTLRSMNCVLSSCVALNVEAAAAP